MGLVVLGIGIAAFLFTRRPILQAAPQPIYTATPVTTPIAVQIAATQDGDDRYTRAPKPERHWITQPDLPTASEMYGKLPRVPTRGIPETYQSMGVITMEDGGILPLYGRRTASRSDRFQYYTRTDSYNPVQLPVRHKNKPCEDVNGCEELFDGDSIKLSPNGESGTVKIYRFSGPTYIPLIG
jgi:hypothetical protein